MNYSVAMAIGTNERAVSHLLRGDGQEDACFGLYMPSQGSRRFTGLVTEIVLPRRERESFAAMSMLQLTTSSAYWAWP